MQHPGPFLRLAGRFGRAIVLPARGVARRLGLQPIVDHVDDDLGLALRLHGAAHHAERHPGLAVPDRETGDDGLEGPLARRIDVGMAVGQGEQLAPVLEHEAQRLRPIVRRQARAHAAIVGLDPADHHPVAVGDAEIGGVAVVRGVAGHDAIHHPIRPDQPGPFGGIGFGIQPFDRGLGESVVCEPAGPVLERQPLGLGLYVQGGGGLEAHGFQIELFADVQDLVGAQPLRVRPQTEDIHAAIVGLDRLDPFGVVGGQVGAGHPTADSLEIGLHLIGQGTVVEGVAPALGDQPQGLGQIRVGEQLADLGRRAAGGPDALSVVVLLDRDLAPVEGGHVALQIVGDDLGHGRALFAQFGDRQQHLLPRQFPIPLVRAPPGVDRAGHIDRHRPIAGQIAVDGPGSRHLKAKPARTGARSVQTDDLLLLGVPQHAIGVAADAVGDRLQEAQGRIDGDGRVDGRSAASQGVYADQAGGRMRRRRRPVRAPDGRTAHELRPRDPVADADAGVGVGRAGRGGRWRRLLGLGRVRRQHSDGQGGQEGATTHGRTPRTTDAASRPCRLHPASPNRPAMAPKKKAASLSERGPDRFA